MHKNCIVSVGIGAWHPRGVERLRISLNSVNFNGDFIGYTNDYPNNSPTHQQTPYAFKAFAMDEMRRLGYQNVMWFDSSFWAFKPINHLFDHIENHGYLMSDSEHMVGTWTSDQVLNDFNVSRDQAMKIKMFTAGGFGLNFKNEKSNKFLDKWLEKAKDGKSFNGPWKNIDKSISKDERCAGHRHDMSVGSLIANELEMLYIQNNTFYAYFEWYQKYKNNPDYDTRQISLLLQGM